MVSAQKYASAGKELLAYAQRNVVPYVAGGGSLDGMDCQGLCEYLLTQCGEKYNDCNLAGSNAHYRKCVWVGTPEECQKKYGCVPEGAWLFILEQDDGEPAKYKGDGVGNASHMGVYLGNNLVVHASSSRGKVTESAFFGKTIQNGGWNRVGFPVWVDYGFDYEDGGGYVSEEMKAIYDARVVTANGGHLNFRKAPRKGGTDIGDIPCGQILQVFEEVDGDWVKVWWEGRFGYVMRAFLEPIFAEEQVQDECALFEGEAVQINLPRDVAEMLYQALFEAMAQG